MHYIDLFFKRYAAYLQHIGRLRPSTFLSQHRMSSGSMFAIHVRHLSVVPLKHMFNFFLL